MACLTDGIAKVFDDFGAIAYRLFEPPRRRQLQSLKPTYQPQS